MLLTYLTKHQKIQVSVTKNFNTIYIKGLFDGADISDSESDIDEKVEETPAAEAPKKNKPKGGISLFGGAIQKNFFKVTHVESRIKIHSYVY